MRENFALREKNALNRWHMDLHSNEISTFINVVRSTQDFVSVVPNYAETCRFTYTTEIGQKSSAYCYAMSKL